MADINEQISGYGMSISDIQRQRSEINEIDNKALQERFEMERIFQMKLSAFLNVRQDLEDQNYKFDLDVFDYQLCL